MNSHNRAKAQRKEQRKPPKPFIIPQHPDRPNTLEAKSVVVYMQPGESYSEAKQRLDVAWHNGHHPGQSPRKSKRERKRESKIAAQQRERSRYLGARS